MLKSHDAMSSARFAVCWFWECVMLVDDLDLSAIKAGLAAGSLLLIDVREPHEFAAGHIPGSVSMPLSQFDAALLPRDTDKRIVFSCAAGIRSRHALAAAQAAGLPLTEHYGGGFRDWVMAGEKVDV
jgi:rhodanese-related sulfurtransferase